MNNSISLEELSKEIGKTKARLNRLEKSRISLVAESSLRADEAEIAKSLLKEIQDIDGYVIRSSGRYWICSHDVDGCLHRCLYGSEISAIQPFLKELKR